MQTGATTVESSKEIPQKIKNVSAFLLSVLTYGDILKKPKHLFERT